MGVDIEPGPSLAQWNFLRKEITVNGDSARRILDLGPGRIPQGRLVCILGPSGCGKTSLLAILGLVDHEFHSDLTLMLNGSSRTVGQWPIRRRMRESSPLRQRIGFVFQEMRLRTGASAVENVVDPMLYIGLGTRKDRQQHARRMLGLFGLQEEDFDRPISSFSGGMQQRTGLARALSIGPDLIIADEPTAHVDDRMADAIYADLKRRSAERGITVVVATHNEEMAHRHADHIIRFEPMFEDEDKAREAREAGEWPFRISVEREATGMLPPVSSSGTPASASASTRFTDMARVALAEFEPMARVFGRTIRAVGWGWAAAIRRRLQNRPRVRREGIPPHRYLPLLVSIVTFGLLAAMGFSLYGVKAAIVSYQEEKLDALESLRRVRVVDPGDISGAIVALDLPDIQQFARQRGVPIAHADPVFDLGGEALIPAELDFLVREGRWAPVQASALFDPASVDGRDKAARRNVMTLLGARADTPEARDLGLPNDEVALSSGENSPPTMWIARNEWEWHYGNFDALPEPGAIVGLMFAGLASTARTDEASPDVAPPAVCVRFRIGGYFNRRREPSGFRSEVQATSYKGVIHKEVEHRLLAWQADPLNAARTLPEAWRCPGSPAYATHWTYRDPEEPREPSAATFDFFAHSPRAALELERILEEYAIDRGIVFGSISSERGFIEQVSRLIRLAEFVGFVLHVLPLAVGGVVLWLVVHEILFRRREDLLLFCVMGAPSTPLYVQSFVLATLVVLPAILIGFLLGRVGPQLMVRFMSAETMPTELVSHLTNVSIGWMGLAQTTGAALVFATLASATVVKSILASNPASAFRGMQ